MWSTIFFLLLSTAQSFGTTPQSQLIDTQIHTQAHDWIHHSIGTSDALLVSKHDLVIALNYFYLSYMRSHVNLKAQESATKILNSVWSGWQNIATRRRNPSKKIPYCHVKSQLNEHAQRFTSVLHDHEHFATLYDTANELIFKGNALENKLLKKNMEFVKDESRNQVTHALLDVQSHIAQLMDYLQQHRRMRIDDEQVLDDLEITRGKIFEYLQEHVPQMAFNSFVKADVLFLTISQNNWKALHTAQELSNIIWQAIETARSHLFYIYYDLTYEIALACGAQPLLMFDEQGLITTEGSQELLPQPRSLLAIEE